MVQIQALTNSSVTNNVGFKEAIIKIQCEVNYNNFVANRQIFLKTPTLTETLSGITWPSTCPVDALTVSLKS